MKDSTLDRRIINRENRSRGGGGRGVVKIIWVGHKRK